MSARATAALNSAPLEATVPVSKSNNGARIGGSIFVFMVCFKGKLTLYWCPAQEVQNVPGDFLALVLLQKMARALNSNLRLFLRGRNQPSKESVPAACYRVALRKEHCRRLVPGCQAAARFFHFRRSRH